MVECQQTVNFIAKNMRSMFIAKQGCYDKQGWYLHRCELLMVMTCHENTHPGINENRKPVKPTL